MTAPIIQLSVAVDPREPAFGAWRRNRSADPYRLTGMRVRSLRLLTTAVLVAGCAGDSDAPGDGAVQDLRVVEINGAQVRTDGSLVVNLNVCNADENVVDVIESDDEVRLTARTDGPKEGDECSDGAAVVLDAPLGTRRLVDEATGNEVVVDVETN